MWDLALAGSAGSAAAGSRPIRLFEAACGEGLLASALRRVADQRGLELAYTGSDLSPAGVGLAQEAVPGEFVVGDAGEVLAGLPAASQDVVVAKNLLHHLDDPTSFLRQAGRVAGPEGRVVLVEARLGCLPFLLVTLLFFAQRERHFFKGRRRNLDGPVRDAGLSAVHAERFSWVPWELLFAIRVDWFRRLFSTDDPRTIRRVAEFDDWLARRLPWGTAYEIWSAAASSPAVDAPPA